MKSLRLFALLTVVCCIAGAAYAADDANALRGNIFYSFPTGQVTAQGMEVEADNSVGVDISYERRVSDLVGLQFGAGWTDYDIKAKGNGIDEKFATLTAIPTYAGLLFHPISRSSSIDWYIGPQIAFVMYDNLKWEDNGDTSVDDDLTWAMRTGLDIMFGGGKVGLNFDVMYYDTNGGNALQYYDAAGDYRTKDIAINPYNVSVGVVWRF